MDCQAIGHEGKNRPNRCSSIAHCSSTQCALPGLIGRNLTHSKSMLAAPSTCCPAHPRAMSPPTSYSRVQPGLLAGGHKQAYCLQITGLKGPSKTCGIMQQTRKIIADTWLATETAPVEVLGFVPCSRLAENKTSTNECVTAFSRLKLDPITDGNDLRCS